MRDLPKTEQAGGYVDPSERIQSTPPPPKIEVPRRKSSTPKPKLTVTTKKAGPPSPKKSPTYSAPKKSAPSPSKLLESGTQFVKTKLPGEADLIDSVAKPFRISPPKLEDLQLPPGLDERAKSAAKDPVEAHEEKIESMLPSFSPTEYKRPEVEMTYVQAAPLSRAAPNLFDFAVKHFVRIPVNAPVQLEAGSSSGAPPSRTTKKTEPVMAERVTPPPPSLNDTGDPLNGFTITSLHQTDFNLENSEMVFAGDVFCETPEFQLSCDEFIVHLRKDMKGMAYGEAKGNVVITTVKNGQPTGHTGYGRHAIYRPDQDNLILSGWPRIRYNGKEHVAATAETQMILGTDGAVKTLGRSKTRFVN